MNLQHVTAEAGVRPAGFPSSTLNGPWRGIARLIWVVVAVLCVGLFVASVPLHVAQLRTVCSGTGCSIAQLTPDGLQALRLLGLSIGVYAAYLLALEVVFALVFFATAGVIFWRRSDERLALLVALVLIVVGAIFPEAKSALIDLRPGWSVLVRLLEALSIVGFTIFCYLFPDGRFVPPWTRAAALLVVAWQVPAVFFPDSPFSPTNLPPLLDFLFYSIWFGSMIFVQIYRFRRVSGPLQRQQTKWLVFGMTTAIAGFLASALVLPLLFPLNLPGSLYFLAVTTAIYCSVLLIPLSLAMAILRSRLWDIDLLINRALVYAALTSALALLYLSNVVVLQQVFRVLTGEEHSELVTIASTLGIAALFMPLRQRVQSFIDRRFYRRRYDAARTLAAFSTKMRDEVDLNCLTYDLVAVIDETMQPAHVSLWLRPPDRRHRQGEN